MEMIFTFVKVKRLLISVTEISINIFKSPKEKFESHFEPAERKENFGWHDDKNELYLHYEASVKQNT